jgi:nucleotide-binding universal stress UspA family protein
VVGLRYLIVANRTLGGGQLAAHLQQIIEDDPSPSVHVVVPALPPAYVDPAAPMLGGFPAIDEEVERANAEVATNRLERLLTWLHSAGVEATGEIGRSEPLLAMDRAVREHGADAIVISTHPFRMSRWLRMDLPHRARRHFNIPVTSVIDDDEELTPLARRKERVQPLHHLRLNSPLIGRCLDLLHVDVAVGPASQIRAALEHLAVKCMVDTAVGVDAAIAAIQPRVGDDGEPAATEIVVVDLGDAGPAAMTLLTRLGESVEHDRPAIVAMTTSVDPDIWKQAHQLGAWACLRTPTRFEDLVQVLDTVVYELVTLGTTHDART